MENKKYTEAEIIKIIYNLREEFADLVHDTWSHWMRYILEMDRTEFQDNYDKWIRQCETEYKDLSKKEKDSDRIFADKFIKLINSKFMTSSGFIEAIKKSKLVGYKFN